VRGTQWCVAGRGRQARWWQRQVVLLQKAGKGRQNVYRQVVVSVVPQTVMRQRE